MKPTRMPKYQPAKLPTVAPTNPINFSIQLPPWSTMSPMIKVFP